MLRNKRLLSVCTVVVLVGVGMAMYLMLHEKARPVSDNPTLQKISSTIPALEAEVKKNGGNATAHYNLGVAYYATQRTDKAIDQYKWAISIDPKNGMYHNNLANAYRDTRKFADAKSEYEKAIGLNGKDKTPYVNLANLQLYYLNDPVGAVSTYNTAISQIDKPYDLMLLKGLAYEKAGQNDNAIETYRDILKKDSTYLPARNNLDRLKAN